MPNIIATDNLKTKIVNVKGGVKHLKECYTYICINKYIWLSVKPSL